MLPRSQTSRAKQQRVDWYAAKGRVGPVEPGRAEVRRRPVGRAAPAHARLRGPADAGPVRPRLRGRGKPGRGNAEEPGADDHVADCQPDWRAGTGHHAGAARACGQVQRAVAERDLWNRPAGQPDPRAPDWPGRARGAGSGIPTRGFQELLRTGHRNPRGLQGRAGLPQRPAALQAPDGG